MNAIPFDLQEREAIARAIEPYLEGARSGSSAAMKPAFHEDATIFGHAGTTLFAGPIQQLFDWHDANGAARDLQSLIAAIDVIGTVATLRLELDDWCGQRFTDLFTLLKTGGDWKIVNKVFHLHTPEGGATGTPQVFLIKPGPFSQ